MNYLTQILGIGDILLMDILSENKLIVDRSTDEYGRIEILVGDQLITLLLGKAIITDQHNSVWCPSVGQYQIGD